jgi:hypothetical protein
MLQLLRLSAEIADRVYEAQSKSIAALLQGWDEEIKAHAEALKQIAKKRAEQAVTDATNAASLEVYLRGLVSQALGSKDDISVSIPGISFASDIVGGPSIDSLHSLVDAIREANDVDPSQKGAALALANGFMPHPADVASMMDQLGVDARWSRCFHALADKMEQAQREFGPHPQQKAASASTMLGALKDQRNLLEAYGADRLFRLVADPSSLAPIDKRPPSFTARLTQGDWRASVRS